VAVGADMQGLPVADESVRKRSGAITSRNSSMPSPAMSASTGRVGRGTVARRGGAARSRGLGGMTRSGPRRHPRTSRVWHRQVRPAASTPVRTSPRAPSRATRRAAPRRRSHRAGRVLWRVLEVSRWPTAARCRHGAAGRRQPGHDGTRVPQGTAAAASTNAALSRSIASVCHT
jgi:hypothetical protein